MKIDLAHYQMDNSRRVLYIPHDEPPRFVMGIPDNFQPDEALCISSNLSVVFSITHSTPNPFLAKYGYIFSNIPGDAVIGYEIDGEIMDIPLNILDDLPSILKKDADARSTFEREAHNYGNVIYF